MTAPGESEPRTDRELVQAVLGGERSAYRPLIERHEDMLFRRALSILGDPDLAADMVQDTFIRAYGRLADCSYPDRFGGWLYRALRNRCYDDLRAARRRGRPLSAVAPLAGEEDPHVDAERNELARAIDRALDSLSPPLREAFVLKHVEGLDYEAMREATDASESALKMRVKRAREELKDILAPYLGPPVDVTRDAARSSDEWTHEGSVEREQS